MGKSRKDLLAAPYLRKQWDKSQYEMLWKPTVTPACTFQGLRG